MSFLSVGMLEVLNEVKKSQAKTHQRETLENEQDRFRRENHEKEERENQEFEARVTPFELAFPSTESRQEYFQKFAGLYPMLSLNGPVVRNMAISAWCEVSGYLG